MSRDDLHFRLRIPEELKNRIERSAVRNHRSMTAEIVARLETSFDENERLELSRQNRIMTDNQIRLKDEVSRAMQALDDGDLTLARNLLVVAAWFEPPNGDTAKHSTDKANKRS